MQQLLLGVAVLACPIGMGLMMWMMMRGGQNKGADDASEQQQLRQLREEINALKADRVERQGS
ncbi:hypothetical protein CBI38_35965 (plasmid) [Rhodococcus oxybenzonivorans]|uniref:DUF2933 domain-containing protein n=1 Tax=Rhodococcus oxybenzonivorans TaxID=1990687 RepID=A0A2S2C7F5_9NOCA|nr:hypothetical protein [Rhodococcus oxybenzonivorans]AWK76807.1 hypothetical protein CBI38_35965 [Rhodococcus oxybenzonivorans]